MADNITVSGTGNPYATGSYTPESNDKNTLTIESYFKLLAAQLQNQDMTNPMDNSEMMAQMTQMAMVQSMSSMTTAIDTSTQISVSTYAASLINQEITVAVTEKNSYGQAVPVGVAYGKVVSVDLASAEPTVKIVDEEGNEESYPISYVLGLGKLPNPYEKEEDEEETEGGAAEESKSAGSVVADFLKK